MTSLVYKQHNYKKSAHHKNNLLAHHDLLEVRRVCNVMFVHLHSVVNGKSTVILVDGTAELCMYF